MYRPIWKEAGVRETSQPFVKELLSDADPTNLRKSDFEIRECALGRGLPIVCDMCMGRALHADGTPHTGASNVDGATIKRLVYRKLTRHGIFGFGYVTVDRVLGPRLRRGVALGPGPTKVASIHPLLRLMLSPHIFMYVRAFRGPVGACVRLCLGDS